MRKILCLLLTLVMLLTMTACSLLPDGLGSGDSDNADPTPEVSTTPLPYNPTIDIPDNMDEAFDAVLLDVYEEGGVWYVEYCDPIFVTFPEQEVKAFAAGGSFKTVYGDVSINDVETDADTIIVNGEYYFTKGENGYTMTVGVMPYFTKGEEVHKVPVADDVIVWDQGFNCDCEDLPTMFDTHYKKNAYELNDEFFVGMTLMDGAVNSIMRMDF